MSRDSRRRHLRRAAIAATFAIVAALAWLAHALVAVGTGFFAKQLCSGVFVSGREPAQVASADLHIYPPALVMANITWRVERDRREVHASLFGLAPRRARERPGFGCALDFGTMAALPSSEPRAAVASDGQWPLGERVVAIPNALLDEALERAFAPAQGTRAVVVVHAGRIVGERYAEGFSADTPLPGWSMAKSVVNALVGVLVSERRLRLDEPLGLSAWSAPDDARRAITFEHALTMTTGLAFDENYANPLADVTRMLFAGGDVGAFAQSRAPRAAPGSLWAYTSGTTNLIMAALRERLGADYASFPRRALFDRLGMASAVFEADASGTFVGSSFLYATARDWARFGLLFAQDGLWLGERVLPEGWVTRAAREAPGSSGRYGAHFWRGAGDARVGATAPIEDAAFHAAGHAGQFITVVPSQRLVVVRLGLSLGEPRWDQTRLVRDALAALK